MTQLEEILSVIQTTKQTALEVFKDSCNHTKDAIKFFAAEAGVSWSAALAQKEAQTIDFDAWSAHPYTKVLENSIAEDYVPKEAQQEPVATMHESPDAIWFTKGRDTDEYADAVVHTFCYTSPPNHRAVLEQALEALEKFSKMYGCLFDTTDGRGVLSIDSCDRYDAAHGTATAAIAAIREQIGETK